MCTNFVTSFQSMVNLEMGSISSQILAIPSQLSSIAKANCAVTYKIGNNHGRDFPEATNSIVPTGVLLMEPRVNTALVTALVNDDLTDCVEVFTPFSAFSHLGNGQGLFRSAKSLQPLFAAGGFGSGEPSPLMVKAILEGLEEFQEKISAECDSQFQDCQHAGYVGFRRIQYLYSTL